jgi:hypothetical protein
MKLQTKIPLRQAENQIDYNDQLLLLGSCFSENIGSKLKYFKFQFLQNPFGILFHPLAIEKLITKVAHNEVYSEADIFFLNERWHSFDVHSDLSDASQEKLLEKLNSRIKKTRQQINGSTYILITLGTAWVYRRNETKEAVANCHKVPQREFSKELLSVEVIQKSLENTISLVRSINEKTQFIFTVSPVRHLKDGFIENQRSKAHLIAAVQNSISSPSFGGGWGEDYFPSYELLLDELRDYRFYETDMIHPNQLAIDYIWEKFSEVWISPKEYPTMEKVDAVQKGLRHRPFNEESEEHRKFLNSLQEKIKYLQDAYPFMEF